MNWIILPALLTLSLIFAACSATAAPLQADPQPDSVPTESSSPSNDSAKRTDEQGAIIFEITPLNLDAPTDTLEFDVVLTTHSIDLSMDLTTLSILTTDTGISVDAVLWDAPLGGHHVEGKLIFPATEDGKSIIEGATNLILTIRNVDAPSRIFEWELK